MKPVVESAILFAMQHFYNQKYFLYAYLKKYGTIKMEKCLTPQTELNWNLKHFNGMKKFTWLI